MSCLIYQPGAFQILLLSGHGLYYQQAHSQFVHCQAMLNLKTRRIPNFFTVITTSNSVSISITLLCSVFYFEYF